MSEKQQQLLLNLIAEDEDLKECDYELNVRSEKWPIRDAVPNIAQIRCLKCYQQPHSTYPDKYPLVKIFRAGNGIGKTCVLAWMVAGASLGRRFLNPKYFYHQYFDECEEIRKKRHFWLRIVCDKTDVEEGGSIYQQISKWIPIAQWEGKNASYFTRIRIPAPSREYYETIIDIKTFDQDTVAHAGPDKDLIVFNEPPKQDKYNENVGRVRSGGRLALFLTPLNEAEYLHKIEDGEYPDGEVDVTVGTIWDNCKDIPGTNGILSKTKIDGMIRQWRENNELEVPARERGEYMHLSGAVFPIFNRDVHVIPPVPIDPKWNIYKVIDPHDSKPPFCLWIAVTPLNDCYVIAEYPTAVWTSINTTHLTISNFVEEFKNIENGKNEKFPYIKKLIIDECIGDPNKFHCRQSDRGMRLDHLYEHYGCEMINTKISDDVAMRIERIRKLLYFDPFRKVESPNIPKLKIFETCTNVIRAVKNFQFKQNQGMGGGMSDKVDKTHECPIACLGYFAVSFDGYQEKRIEKSSYFDEFDDSEDLSVENYDS